MSAAIKDPRSAKFYRNVPTGLVEQLEQFRASFPYRSANVDGVSWPYIDAGQGQETILMLSGAGCIAEISWRTIEGLSRRYRVIAPDYPAIDSVSGLADGIMRLLDQLKIGRVHVMGGSYGGLMAQALVREYPDRTNNLILSHTLLPTRQMSEKNAAALRWLQIIPAWLLRAIFKRSMGRLYSHSDLPEVALLKAHFEEIVSNQLTRAQIISMLRRTVDLGLNYTFTPGDLAGWPGRVLLILAKDDPASPEPVRQALMAMYPRARLRLFSGSGHMTSVLQQAQYVGAIEEILSEKA